jgi:hypothetical protein
VHGIEASFRNMCGHLSFLFLSFYWLRSVGVMMPARPLVLASPLRAYSSLFHTEMIGARARFPGPITCRIHDTYRTVQPRLTLLPINNGIMEHRLNRTGCRSVNWNERDPSVKGDAFCPCIMPTPSAIR